MELEAVRVGLLQKEMFAHQAASLCMAVIDVQALATRLDCSRVWLKRNIGLVAKDHGLPKSAILREAVADSGPESLRRRYLRIDKLPPLLRALGYGAAEIRAICHEIHDKAQSRPPHYEPDADEALQRGLRALEVALE